MTIVGYVYKWKEEFLRKFWERYFLMLDEKKGRIFLVKKSSQVRAYAELRRVFLAIHLRQFQPTDDGRLAKVKIKFAPYALIIPMAEVGFEKYKHHEFALTSLDELETWMKKFAECVGALERLQQFESQHQNQCLLEPDQGQRPTGQQGVGGGSHSGTRPGRFNTYNQYGYDSSYYPWLWASFVSSEQNDHHAHYQRSHPIGCAPGEPANWEPVWLDLGSWFTSCQVIDPSTGAIVDPRSCSTGIGSGGENSSWASFFDMSYGGWDTGHGGNDWSAGTSADAGGGWNSDWCESGGGGYDGGGCDSGGGGCDCGGGCCDCGGGCCDCGGGGCDCGGGDCDCGGGGCDCGGCGVS